MAIKTLTEGVEHIGIDAVKCHPKNPRKGNVDLVKESIQVNGFFGALVVQRSTGYILAGNHRWMAAKDLGMQFVPVIYVDVTDRQAEKILLADNRTSDVAEYNNTVLAEILSQLSDLDSLAGTGYDDAFLENLIEEIGGWESQEESGETPEPQLDKAEELRIKWGVEHGQIWQVGQHRVMCGDSTSEKDVSRLIENARIRILATSPPYSDQREYNIGKFNWLELANGFIDAIKPMLMDPCDILVNLGVKYKDGRINQYWQPWLDHCDSIGFPLYGFYVWDQLSGMPGDYHGRLARSHEFIFHYSIGHNQANKWIETTGESQKRGVRHRFRQKRFRQKDGSLKEAISPTAIGQPYKIPDSVIRVRREMTRGIHTENHPAVFPVEFPSFLLQTWSNINDCAYEPFCGSGTTIVACEQINRIGYGMELDPSYVAVTLQRLADMGLEPVLINGTKDETNA